METNARAHHEKSDHGVKSHRIFHARPHQGLDTAHNSVVHARLYSRNDPRVVDVALFLECSDFNQ